jgi:glucose/arabinose dehydrogenase
MIQRRLLFVLIIIAGALIAIPTTYLVLEQNRTSVGTPQTNNTVPESPPNFPTIRDDRLVVQEVIEGLNFPTSMAFLDYKTILVLEKNGAVRVVVDGVLHDQPLLEIPVRTEGERGLLGIAIIDENGDGTIMTAEDGSKKSVFLYLTEVDEENLPRNRVYRYDWQDGSLTNPSMILDLPATPGVYHNGGKLVAGPDGNLYVSMGYLANKGMLQNHADGSPPDDTGVILRIDYDGTAAHNNPLSSDDPEMNERLSKYYAYGVRNSFGMAFDPVTDILWITDNGAIQWDEINMVMLGFNGGWDKVRGPSRSPNPQSNLVEFQGSYYGDPAFSWFKTIGITDIEFLESDVLGGKYKNNIFVGDFNHGNLYYFKLDDNRTGFAFDDSQRALSDLIAHENELSLITFGTGFAGITEIETGPDGYLYILSYINGKMYRIAPAG